MGDLSPEDMARGFDAFENALREQGLAIEAGVSTCAARAVLEEALVLSH